MIVNDAGLEFQKAVPSLTIKDHDPSQNLSSSYCGLLYFVFVKEFIMCHKCIKAEYPMRDRMVLESGSYMQNLQACSECGTRDVTNADKHEQEDEDGTEVTTFSHRCAGCQHVIAVHRHTFSVEDGYQEYAMECSLCGNGQDSHSVLPDDPQHSLQAQLM